MEKNKLIQDINAAFVNFTVLPELEEPGDFEQSDVYYYLKGKRWQDIKLDLVSPGGALNYTNPLLFLSGYAFVFYLPAFMLIELENVYQNIGLSYNAVFVLGRCSERAPQGAGIEFLNKRQVEVILEYLNHFKSLDPEGARIYKIGKAQSFWKKVLKKMK